MRMDIRAACIAAAALVLNTTASAADPIADFYRGKTVTIAIGFGPAGGYDTYARILARHLGDHIPGKPNVLAQNMPGAGSMKLANYVYNVAPKDGTYIGMFSAQTALEPLYGNANARFETAKFTWIGNMHRDTGACGAWHSTGIASLQDLLKSDKEVIFGSTGASTNGHQHALILKSMMGAKVKLISGYKGIKDVNLAMQQGEVQAACGMSQSATQAAFANEVERGQIRMFVQFGRENVPFFGKATNFYSLLKTDEDRQIADLFFGTGEISRPFTAPPGLRAEITAALRGAMMATLADPGLLADARKSKNDISPMSGEEVAARFAAFAKTPPAIVKKALAIIGRN